MISLRPYQNDAVADFHRTVAVGNKRRIIVVAPTGAGKTIIGASIVTDLIRDLNKSVLVLAHRREIITQTCSKLLAAGFSHGVIQAGVRPRPLERVQVASIQTLWVRAMHAESMELPPADLLWIDECHHVLAMMYRKIINAYPDAILLGTSATPTRGDGRGLGGIFETIIETPQVAELIKQKYLVGTRVYAPIDPDLRGVQTRQGDFVEAQLAERMDRPQLVGESSSTGTNSASAARPSPSRPACSTRSTSATNSSSPACGPSISTARHRSPSAMPRSPAWSAARSILSPIAMYSPKAGTALRSPAAS